MQQVRRAASQVKAAADADFVRRAKHVAPVGLDVSEVTEPHIVLDSVKQIPGFSSQQPALFFRMLFQLADRIEHFAPVPGGPKPDFILTGFVEPDCLRVERVAPNFESDQEGCCRRKSSALQLADGFGEVDPRRGPQADFPGFTFQPGAGLARPFAGPGDGESRGAVVSYNQALARMQ
jgi:hypothetical protein